MVVLVDEIAFLTAYQADRKLKDRILAALATLTTQGRAVGYCVVAALQDPRKEVLNIRNLFPDKTRAAPRRARPGRHGPRRRRTGPRRVLRRDLPRPGHRRGRRPTSAWKPRPTRCASGPRSSATTTSAT